MEIGVIKALEQACTWTATRGRMFGKTGQQLDDSINMGYISRVRNKGLPAMVSQFISFHPLFLFPLVKVWGGSLWTLGL